MIWIDIYGQTASMQTDTFHSAILCNTLRTNTPMQIVSFSSLNLPHPPPSPPLRSLSPSCSSIVVFHLRFRFNCSKIVCCFCVTMFAYAPGTFTTRVTHRFALKQYRIDYGIFTFCCTVAHPFRPCIVDMSIIHVRFVFNNGNGFFIHATIHIYRYIYIFFFIIFDLIAVWRVRMQMTAGRLARRQLLMFSRDVLRAEEYVSYINQITHTQ